MVIEVCAQSIQSCLNAQKGGAWRIELCQALELGGLTPSAGLIQMASNYITLPIHILVRPRLGDFVYSRMELEQIQREIENAKVMGAAGVVIGILNNHGEVDERNLARFVELAYPMEVTFHRAIDTTTDLFESANIILNSGCHRILTSGGAASAMDGIENLKKLQIVYGSQIGIMAGKGVNADNIARLHEVGITEFHMSASAEYEGIGETKLFEMNYFETEMEEVKRAKKVIKQLRALG